MFEDIGYFNDNDSISKQSIQYKQHKRYMEQHKENETERQGPQTEQKRMKKSRLSKQTQNFDCAVSVFSSAGYQEDFLNQSSDMINMNMKHGSVDLHYNYDPGLQSTAVNVLQKPTHHDKRQMSMQVNADMEQRDVYQNRVINSACPKDITNNYYNHPTSIHSS